MAHRNDRSRTLSHLNSSGSRQLAAAQRKTQSEHPSDKHLNLVLLPPRGLGSGPDGAG